MKKSSSVILASFIAIISCSNIANAQTVIVGELANKLAQSSIIVDGHIDVPYRVHDGWVDVSKATIDGDFDYPRARAGGLNAPFMSIYVPAGLDDSDKSTAHAHRLIDYVEALVGRAPSRYAIATSPDAVERQFKQGLISLPLGMENGSPIQGNLDNLQDFHDRGIRYITLTHSKSNHISDSSYDDNKQWGGLSEFGLELVKDMNRLGIMVDVSHVSDAAFYDVVKTSVAPVIASHSSMRKFTPGFERNMDDAMVTALAKNGGIIMINFGSTFLTREARTWSDQRKERLSAVEKQHGKDGQQAKDFGDNYRVENPLPYADLGDVIAHIDHAIKLVGVEHVGLGSDFDGVGDSLPEGLKSVADYPALVQAMLDKQYSQADIKNILGGNLLRVWREVESVSQTHF